jgi:hypothetical protein
MMRVKNIQTAAQFGYHCREYEGYLGNIGGYDPGSWPHRRIRHQA